MERKIKPYALGLRALIGTSENASSSSRAEQAERRCREALREIVRSSKRVLLRLGSTDRDDLTGLLGIAPRFTAQIPVPCRTSASSPRRSTKRVVLETYPLSESPLPQAYLEASSGNLVSATYRPHRQRTRFFGISGYAGWPYGLQWLKAPTLGCRPSAGGIFNRAKGDGENKNYFATARCLQESTAAEAASHKNSYSAVKPN